MGGDIDSEQINLGFNLKCKRFEPIQSTPFVNTAYDLKLHHSKVNKENIACPPSDKDERENSLTANHGQAGRFGRREKCYAISSSQKKNEPICHNSNSIDLSLFP